MPEAYAAPARPLRGPGKAFITASERLLGAAGGDISDTVCRKEALGTFGRAAEAATAPPPTWRERRQRRRRARRLEGHCDGLRLAGGVLTLLSHRQGASPPAGHLLLGAGCQALDRFLGLGDRVLDLGQLVFHFLGGALCDERPFHRVEVNGVLRRLHLPRGSIRVHREGVTAGQVGVLEALLAVEEEREPAPRREHGDGLAQNLLEHLGEVRLARFGSPPRLQGWVAGDADVAGDGWAGVLDDQQHGPVGVGLDVDDDVRLVLLPVNALLKCQLAVGRLPGDRRLPEGDDGSDERGDGGDDDRPLVGGECSELVHDLTLPARSDTQRSRPRR
ncbi:hypothetical protein BN2537_2397 [Streptomyces venezuelae]|nr:hypothetical protein BN2537_2397 [Streptomyces venezuelae]